MLSPAPVNGTAAEFIPSALFVSTLALTRAAAMKENNMAIDVCLVNRRIFFVLYAAVPSPQENCEQSVKP
jgi:hypothetical protein